MAPFRILQLLSGHPLLVPAAMEAVKQWVYKPTLLNGEPVEVITDNRREFHFEPVVKPASYGRRIEDKFNSQERENNAFTDCRYGRFMLLQEGGGVGWDPRSLWDQMGALAKCVVIVLFIMSAWSIGVMIDRVMAYNAARKQIARSSLRPWPARCAKASWMKPIKIADRYKKSHLAKVVVAGLQEFQAHQISSEISG